MDVRNSARVDVECSDPVDREELKAMFTRANDCLCNPSTLSDGLIELDKLVQFPVDVFTAGYVMNLFNNYRNNDELYVLLGHIFVTRPRIAFNLLFSPLFDFFISLDFPFREPYLTCFENYVSASPATAGDAVCSNVLENIQASGSIDVFLPAINSILIQCPPSSALVLRVFEIISPHLREFIGNDSLLTVISTLLSISDSFELYKSIAESNIINELLDTFENSREYRKNLILSIITNITGSTSTNMELFFSVEFVDQLLSLFFHLSEQSKAMVLGIITNFMVVSFETVFSNPAFSRCFIDSVESGGMKRKKKAAITAAELLYHIDTTEQYIEEHGIIDFLIEMLIVSTGTLTLDILKAFKFLYNKLELLDRDSIRQSPAFARFSDPDTIEKLEDLAETGDRDTVEIASFLLSAFIDDSDSYE